MTYTLRRNGGPDGEAAASMRYLSQRYSMPDKRVAGLLTDIGTEELAHFEIIGAMVHQLTRNLTPEQIKQSGFAPYYTDHTLGVWPQAAGGIPFNACEFQVKGDPICDLTEDLAADAANAKKQSLKLKFRKLYFIDFSGNISLTVLQSSNNNLPQSTIYNF